MKPLNSPRKSGWRGRYGWRNIFDVFIREKRQQKRIKKAVEILTQHSSVPVEKSLVVYSPAVKFKTVRIPVYIPTMSFKSLLMIGILATILVIGILSFGFLKWVYDDIDYKERIRLQVIYDINRTLEPYIEQQKEIRLKVSELDNIIIAHPLYRERIIKKLKAVGSYQTVERDIWK